MPTSYSKPRPSGPKRYVKNFYLIEVLLMDGERRVVEINGNQQLNEADANLALTMQMKDPEVVAIWQHKYLLSGHRLSVAEKKIPS